jgi:hypothetical protein
MMYQQLTKPELTVLLRVISGTAAEKSARFGKKQS